MDTIFEWYVVRCGSKNIHRIGMCLKEIGLRAQIMLVILRLNNQHDFGWGGRGRATIDDTYLHEWTSFF